jgi:hypothetical protein
LTFSAVKIV